MLNPKARKETVLGDHDWQRFKKCIQFRTTSVTFAPFGCVDTGICGECAQK